MAPTQGKGLASAIQPGTRVLLQGHITGCVRFMLRLSIGEWVGVDVCRDFGLQFLYHLVYYVTCHLVGVLVPISQVALPTPTQTWTLYFPPSRPPAEAHPAVPLTVTTDLLSARAMALEALAPLDQTLVDALVAPDHLPVGIGMATVLWGAAVLLGLSDLHSVLSAERSYVPLLFSVDPAAVIQNTAHLRKFHKYMEINQLLPAEGQSWQFTSILDLPSFLLGWLQRMHQYVQLAHTMAASDASWPGHALRCAGQPGYLRTYIPVMHILPARGVTSGGKGSSGSIYRPRQHNDAEHSVANIMHSIPTPIYPHYYEAPWYRARYGAQGIILPSRGMASTSRFYCFQNPASGLHRAVLSCTTKPGDSQQRPPNRAQLQTTQLSSAVDFHLFVHPPEPVEEVVMYDEDYCQQLMYPHDQWDAVSQSPLPTTVRCQSREPYRVDHPFGHRGNDSGAGHPMSGRCSTSKVSNPATKVTLMASHIQKEKAGTSTASTSQHSYRDPGACNPSPLKNQAAFERLYQDGLRLQLQKTLWARQVQERDRQLRETRHCTFKPRFQHIEEKGNRQQPAKADWIERLYPSKEIDKKARERKAALIKSRTGPGQAPKSRAKPAMARRRPPARIVPPEHIILEDPIFSMETGSSRVPGRTDGDVQLLSPHWNPASSSSSSVSSSSSPFSPFSLPRPIIVDESPTSAARPVSEPSHNTPLHSSSYQSPSSSSSMTSFSSSPTFREHGYPTETSLGAGKYSAGFDTPAVIYGLPGILPSYSSILPAT